MAAWGYKFYLLVLEIRSALKDKFCIPVQPCNILYLIFQGQQLQKYKEGPNLLQKAKKSLTSSFESFMGKRVRNKANFFHNYMYV